MTSLTLKNCTFTYFLAEGFEFPLCQDWQLTFIRESEENGTVETPDGKKWDGYCLGASYLMDQVDQSLYLSQQRQLIGLWLLAFFLIDVVPILLYMYQARTVIDWLDHKYSLEHVFN